MQESYKEGDAHHFDPESCLDDPRGRGEALTGESTGGLLSSEITPSRMPTWLPSGEGNIKGGDKTRAAFEFGFSRRTWHVWTLSVLESGYLGRVRQQAG